MKINHKPQPWQTNPKNLVGDNYRGTISFWSLGQMVTAQMPLNEAKLLIESGNAFIISSGHVGLLTEGRMDS